MELLMKKITKNFDKKDVNKGKKTEVKPHHCR
jgi:hypothetical protein